MGTYLNPGYSGFERILKGTYVDKTGLIKMINDTIGTTRNLTCVSRPRRFGKSYAAQMLCAYYDKTCDSSEFFSDKLIAQDDSYLTYLNHFQVIYLDMTNILGKAANSKEFISFIQNAVTEDILKMYPSAKKGNAFDETLLKEWNFIRSFEEVKMKNC